MDDLRIRIVTYNVAGKNPEGNINEILGLDLEKENKLLLPDFYLIGLQEVKARPHNYLMDVLFSDPWTNVFRDILIPLGYVKAKTVRLVGILLIVFCLRKHIIHLRDMKSICSRTGLKGLWGNKGGVSQRLKIYGCSICFVNCHLAAHDHLNEERIADYNHILAHQKFVGNGGCNEATSIMFHDYVFWFGDLNFRLDGENTLDSAEIISKITKGDIKSLLAFDQLNAAMVSGEAFSELLESTISFPPTYKFFFQSSDYNPNRRPAWTDRILYKVNADVYENVTLNAIQHSYHSVDSATLSDHKPVIATFTIKVFSHYTERSVSFCPMPMWYTDSVNNAVCIVGLDVEPNIWDWIGIFHDDFTSLDEYVAFIYLSNNSADIPTGVTPTVIRNGERIELSFFENIIRTPGKYRLLYFTQDSGSVLGMSQPFELIQKANHLNTAINTEW